MLSIKLLLAAVLVATAAAQLPAKPYYDLNDADKLFQQFLQQHDKAYSPEEYLTRLDIFKENLKEINERNARYPQTEYGITRFTDWTREERRNYPGFKHNDDSFEGLATKFEYRGGSTAPDQFDWRDHGAVTHIKDQGDCGSCYVFSATGLIEGQYAIKHNMIIALSEQQGVDCTPPAIWGDTCSGGYVHEVLRFYEYHGDLHKVNVGITSEVNYPYIGEMSRCREPSYLDVVTNVTSVHVYWMDEESMKQFLYDTGPVSVAIAFEDFWNYKNGIAYPIKCFSQEWANHAVLVVGYGIDNGTQYWLIKNSFGSKWGEDGYMRLVRGVRACGVGRYVVTCTVP